MSDLFVNIFFDSLRFLLYESCHSVFNLFLEMLGLPVTVDVPAPKHNCTGNHYSEHKPQCKTKCKP